jgi:diguanylate cyclase (GGDEF)-like protein/PAS domain S-box-containing protein
MTKQEESGSERPVILLIDDEKAFRLLAQAALVDSGYDIFVAENGNTALSLLESSRIPDLVLLDLIMPDIDGFTVCSAIRNSPGGQHIPILIMTGLDDYESISRAYDAGATDFITKPINWTLLMYRTRYLLRASQAISQLRESEAKIRGLISAIPDTLVKISNEGHFLVCNPGKSESNDITPLTIVPDKPSPELPEQLLALLRHHFAKGYSNNSVEIFDYSQRLEGLERHWEVRLVRSGESNALALIRDFTKRKTIEQELRQLSRAVEQSPTSILITDNSGNIEYVNPQVCELTGYRLEELIGKSLGIFAAEKHSNAEYEAIRKDVLSGKEWRGEFRTRKKDGEHLWERASISAIRDDRGTPTHLLVIKENITQYKESENYIHFLAFHDRLTGLPNRILFREKVQMSLTDALRANESVVVMLLDINDFKRINDTLGQHSGDLILQYIADKLQTSFRQSEIMMRFAGHDGNQIARIGGDEFALCLAHVSKPQDAVIAARQILMNFSSPFKIDSQEIFISCNIGIAVYPQDGEDVDTLIKNAEAAMYHTNQSPNDNFQFYSTSMNASVARKLSLESLLRRALDRDEFRLVFQPQVNAATMRVEGAETLLRWDNPSASPISPAEFIPLAEEYGLIEAIGEWVVRSTCEQANIWRTNGFPPIRLAVNVSGHQLRKQRLFGITRSILDASRIDPQYLEFELTESSILQDTKASLSSIYGFKELGIRIAIDDFGTGYSSLSYLRRFPLDVLKMDKSFVDGVALDPADAALAAGIITMGHSLGLEVVAEGVETADQLEFLRANHCDLIQGYVFSKPLRPEQFELLAFGHHCDKTSQVI